MMISIKKIVFFCISNKKHHASSPVITLLRKSLSFSALEVANVEKRGACSADHEEYCDNFLQKFHPLIQFGPQIYFCHFS